MMRLIDADELIKCIPSEEYNSRFAIMNAHIVEPQKWIPCSERLPDLDEYVLCTVNDQGEGNEVAMMCLTTSIRSDDYYWTDYACEYSWELCEVFAWMPLPEPWGGDSDDNH